MRNAVCCLILSCLVCWTAPPAWAGDQEDALALVNQAIKAHGGADVLTKAQTLMHSGSGTMTLFDKTTPITDEWLLQLPDKMRLVVEQDKKFRVTTVVNGAKAWQSAGGPTMELTADHVRELRNELYVLWLTTLTPLKSDDFKLAPLPDIKVNGAAAVGVKAAAKGKPDVKLYFDKQTNLLVKVERRVSEAGVPMDKEEFLSEHKDFDGVQLPTKQILYINGRKLSEMTGITYKLQKKIDDISFVKP